MKVSILKANLVRLLSELSLVAKAKSTSPILSCCLLETFTDGLRGSATDLYQSVTSSVPVASVSVPGGVVVNAKDLLERVKTLPDGPVQLEKDGEKLRLSTGKRKHSLSIFNPEEFPAVSSKLEGGIAIPGKTLLDLFRRTKPMAAVDSDRASIKSVYLEFEDGKLLATSTDGSRLSFCFEAVEACKKAQGRMVPIDAVDSLLGILDAETDVTFGVVGHELAFRSGNVTFSTKLVEGDFPSYVRQGLVTAPECGVLVSRKALLDSLNSVGVASASVVGRHVQVLLSTGTMRLVAEGKGGAEDEIDVKYEGRDVVTCANARYLIDALNAIDSTEVRFNVGGELDALWVRPDEGASPLEIVMPSRPVATVAR